MANEIANSRTKKEAIGLLYTPATRISNWYTFQFKQYNAFRRRHLFQISLIHISDGQLIEWNSTDLTNQSTLRDEAVSEKRCAYSITGSIESFLAVILSCSSAMFEFHSVHAHTNRQFGVFEMMESSVLTKPGFDLAHGDTSTIVVST